MNILKRAKGLRHPTMLLMGFVTALAGCGGGYGGGYGGSGGGSGGGYGTAPIVTFSSPASATTINLGQSLTLSWSSSYATSCSASASSSAGGTFSGSQSLSSSVLVSPTATGDVTYSLNCIGAGGSKMATSAKVTVLPSILSALTTITTIGSTLDPIEQGGNPYGLAIAPVTSGLITAGDLIACNFNDGATNTQGLGTTLIGLHPSAGATPYRIAQSATLQGCAAIATLPDGSIAASAFVANQVPLVSPAGTLTTPFASDAIAAPWGQVYAPGKTGQAPALYVSGQSGGTINRITLNGDAPTAFLEIIKGFCGSGAPGGVFAPAGLTYDPQIDTLYIVDTSSYSVVAISNVSTIGADGIVVNGSCGGPTPTPALSFTGTSASEAKVIASGGQLNAPISAALLMDGNLIVSNGDINAPAVNNLLFEISPAIGFVGTPMQLDTGAAGGLFGLATTTDGSGNQIIYFNDDNDNTVKMLTK